MERLHSAYTLFLSLIVEALPFLLLGVALSSALLLWVDDRRLLSKFPSNPILGALLGSCVGFLFPVCECGNVPVARRLLLQRVPISTAIGFLLAAPTINPVVIWSTWVAFRDRPEIVVWRVVFSLTIAVIVACLFSVQKDVRLLLQPALARRLGIQTKRSRSPRPTQTSDATVPALLQSGSFWIDRPGQPLSVAVAAKEKEAAAVPWRDWLKLFLDNAISELRELSAMLIVGSAIAAAVQTLAPRELVLSLGQGPIASILTMMLLAALVSICSTVDAFFALSFASTFTTGSLLAFLVFGPTIDLKSIGLMLSVFKPRVIFYLFAIVAQLTFLLSLAYTYLN